VASWVRGRGKKRKRKKEGGICFSQGFKSIDPLTRETILEYSQLRQRAQKGIEK
jgi:hypothetical protein